MCVERICLHLQVQRTSSEALEFLLLESTAVHLTLQNRRTWTQPPIKTWLYHRLNKLSRKNVSGQPPSCKGGGRHGRSGHTARRYTLTLLPKIDTKYSRKSSSEGWHTLGSQQFKLWNENLKNTQGQNQDFGQGLWRPEDPHFWAKRDSQQKLHLLLFKLSGARVVLSNAHVISI